MDAAVTAKRLTIGYDASVTLAPQPGGIARYTLELLRALVALDDPGLEFVVLLNSWRHEPGEQHRFLMNDSRVRVVRKKLPGPALVEGWRRLGTPSWESLVGERCDVVHAPASYIPPAACPVVATIHDLGFLRDGTAGAPLAGGYFQKAFPRQLPGLDAVICPSRFVASDVIRQYGLEAGRVHAIHSGIDTERFRPGVGLDDATKGEVGIVDPFVLAVTADVPRKRAEWIPQVAAAWRGTGRPQVVAVGLPARVDARGVLVLRGISDERLAGLYRSAAAVLLTTREEGFGFPLLEAMACGAPVVCGRNSSLAEIGGEWPVYTEEDSVAGLAAALGSVLTGGVDADRRQAASEWARGFTWRRCAEQVAAAYRAAAGR